MNETAGRTKRVNKETRKREGRRLGGGESKEERESREREEPREALRDQC